MVFREHAKIEGFWPPGLSWGSLGALLGLSWALLGLSWGSLGALSDSLGLSWGSLELSWGSLGPSSGSLGVLLGAFLGLSWAAPRIRAMLYFVDRHSVW